ncbi:MAG: OmpA/MotB family protein, partial [Desulfovibrionales bacterium]
QAQSGGGGWLITFCDMMTLLLTFFVLLISMAALTDMSKRLVALQSVYGAFGIGQHGLWVSKLSKNVISTEKKINAGEPGPMENIPDFAQVKPLLWEERGDLHLIQNAVMQVLSIDSKLLFLPGESRLSEKGLDLLKELAPIFQGVAYPIMIQGHTSVLRDEKGTRYRTSDEKKPVHPSWRLSLDRVLHVYRFLLQNGVSPDKLRVEAYGRYSPRFSNNTPEGRERNRRVDFILDKRNSTWAHWKSSTISDEAQSGQIKYKDFIFRDPQAPENRTWD